MSLTEKQNSRASAGGARAASGSVFQAQVFAYWASYAVGETRPGLGLGPQTRVHAVGCETSFHVDDVAAALDDGGFVLMQAKAGMRRLASNAKDLREAVDQLVAAFRNGIATQYGRPFDRQRDRLVIATNEAASGSYDALANVLSRLREHPEGLPMSGAANTEAEAKAFSTFLAIVDASWREGAGEAPSQTDLWAFLRIAEVIRYDFAEDGAHRTRAAERLQRSAATNPFELLEGEGHEAARTRSWRARESLRQKVRYPDASSSRPSSDRQRLLSLTERTLERLDRSNFLVTPDGPVHVTREIAGRLRALHGQSFLLTGHPGVGKSGVLGEAARLAPGDKVVLAVDSVPTDRALAQVQWGLSSDLLDVLRNWEGAEPATLYLDGLDAHRNGPSWLADLVDGLVATRWCVVASIRRFDLSHSKRWRELFGTIQLPTVDQSLANSTSDNVSSLVVPPLSEKELLQLSNASPRLAVLVDQASPRLRDLLANPFNLSLAADLISDAQAERLVSLETQAELLRMYWSAQVLGGVGSLMRAEAARLIVERMVSARSLGASALGLPAQVLEQVEELERRGVLEDADDARRVQLTPLVRFRHHIVFDYAVSAALLGPGQQTLTDLLAGDPDFVVFGRPSIDFHLADLWGADPDHSTFWTEAILLATDDHPLALAAASATAVQRIVQRDDIRAIVRAASSHSAGVSLLLNQLASGLAAAVSAVRDLASSAANVYDELIADLGDVWLEDPEPQLINAIIRMIRELNAITPLPRAGLSAHRQAETIMRILKKAIDAPAAHGWLAERIMHFMPGIASMDPSVTTLLLECLETRVTDEWGLLHLRPVLQRLGTIAATNPAAAGQLAAAPFIFDASADKTVSIGSSLIVNLNESWSQAHGMLRYVVAHDSWKEVEAVDPVAATLTLGEILNSHTADGSADPHIYRVAGLGVSGWLARHGETLEMQSLGTISELVQSSVTALAERASDSNVQDTIRVWISAVKHPDAWNELLRAAAETPALASQLRSVLVDAWGLFVHPATRWSAIQLVAILGPELTDAEHRALEKTVIELPEAAVDQANRVRFELVRDQILVSLTRQRVKHPSALERLKTIEQEGPPPPAAPNSFTLSWDETPDDIWYDLNGIGPDDVPESARLVMESADHVSGGTLGEAEQWEWLEKAVSAEAQLDEGSVMRERVRYLIARYLRRLAESGALSPAEHHGRLAVETLLVIARRVPLPAGRETA